MDGPTGGPTGGQPRSDLPLPRRALRKGTRSCAECKRRKTRCFFSRPTDAACVACQRRGMPCIGQELMDVPLPDLRDEQTIVERLRRAELMLDTISKDISRNGRESQHSGSGSQSVVSEQDLATADQGRDKASHSGCEAVRTVDTSPAKQIPQSGTEEEETLQYAYPKYAELCQALHARLPSQEDVNILFGTGRAIVFVQAICNHYGDLFHEGNLRPIEGMTTLPAVTDHPVLIARKLLQLALCIQQIDPSFDHSSLNLGGCLSDAMDGYFSLASSMVTCHEDLLDSIEGLECLVYEGVFLVNSGNLRRALVCLRRASTLAQFMGMHHRVPYKSLKQHDRDTHVSAAVIWAHIAYLERYICLILGMPTAISRARFASDEIAAGDTSADWFEKMQIDIFERMIDRNQERNYHDFATTQKIDHDLNKMANKLPAKWWAPIDLTLSISTKDMMEKVISAQMQIVHYNLLTVLHLPYLLWHTDDNRFEYSRTTCMYASREVLNRFITFRSIVKVVTCCRPVDFCAFTAALTLLLAYLKSHKQSSGWMLTHQRLGDRALIEAAMETMDELNRINNDELSRKTAELTRKLLALEVDCARGGQTYNSSVGENHEDDTVAGEEHCFHLKIPYFGTVKLACDGPSTQDNNTMAIFPVPRLSVGQYSTSSQSAIVQPDPHNDYAPNPIQIPDHLPVPYGEYSPYSLNDQMITGQFDLEMPDVMASANDWAFQGVDSAFFDALYSGNPENEADQDENWGGYLLSI